MAAATSQLVAFTRPYPWTIPAVVVLGLIASIAEGVGIGLIIPLLDGVLGASPSAPAGPFAVTMQRIAAISGAEHRMPGIALLIFVLVVAKTLIVATNLWVTTLVAGRVTRDLRNSLVDQLLTVDYGNFARQDHGRLVNVLETQTQRAGDAITLLGSLLVCACNVAVFTAMLFLLSWRMSVIVVLVGVPVFFVVRRMSRRAHRHGDQFVKAQATLAGDFLELVGAMRVIRIFGREEAERQRFRAAAHGSYRSFVSSELLAQLMQPFSELLYVPAFLAVFVYAWHTGVGVPSLLAFLLLLYRMQPPLKRMDQARVLLSSYAPGIREVAGLLGQVEPARVRSATEGFSGLRNAIEFDRVSFGYDGSGLQAIQEVSFRIGRGQVVAIVGRSGSGKSTLVNLLCRLYEPSSGEIRIDGVPLRRLSLESWRNRIAVAGQDMELLGRSVGDNLRFGRPNASDAEVVAAACSVQADTFIRDLPAGYGTNIGIRGSLLSGGQRQRLALARAVLRNPDILILDEATNAVDNITEAEIRHNVEQLAGHCTILIIAHRLSTVRRADYVVVLSEGRVVEQGKPDAVVQMAGEFARIYELD